MYIFNTQALPSSKTDLNILKNNKLALLEQSTWMKMKDKDYCLLIIKGDRFILKGENYSWLNF